MPIKRTIVAVQTDKHGGHKLALMNPDVILYDEDVEGNLTIPYSPKPTLIQERIWDWYLQDIQSTIALAAGDEIVYYDLADVTHGNRFIHQQVSTRMSDQIYIAVANMEPWMHIPNLRTIRILKGTEVHEFGEGSAPLLVADRLKAAYPDHDIQVPYHSLAMVDGVRFDMAHHGGHPGSRNWLKGNVLVLYAQSIMLDDLLDGKEPPHVIVRGHFHQWASRIATVQARGGDWETRVTICPSYSFIDDHARKVARSPSRITIGMVAYEIINGQLVKQHPFKRTIDIRTKEILA